MGGRELGVGGKTLPASKPVSTICYAGAMTRAAKKITLNVPEDLLLDAQKMTGLGITETVVLGLEELRRRKKRHALLALRGKVDFDLDLTKTRR